MLAAGGNSGLDTREWNALIGIVTAIVGNALISVALNIQRYAHVKLSRDRLQRQKSWKSQRKLRQSLGMQSYGTQLNVAEERALLNRKAPEMDEEDDDHRAAYHSEEVVENGVDADEDITDERAPLNGNKSVSNLSVSTVQPEEDDGENTIRKKNYLKSPYWWLGIILMTTGEAGNFIAYGFAPASIVSPLGVVALISNCIIAPLLLKEKFRQRDFWGVLIAIAGAVTVVLSAHTKDPRLGPDDIWVAISRWEFELYLGLTALAIVILIWASSKYGQKSVFIDVGLVGLFGGYTALSTKGVASLLTDTIWRAVTFPIFYLLVFVLVSTAIAQIRYVNKALQRFDSTRVVPTQFVCFTISVILGSAVLYREFESTTKENVGKFVGGCAMTFFGVYLITSGKRDQDHENEFDEETGEMEGIHLVDEEQQVNQNTAEDSPSPVAFRPKRASMTPQEATPVASSNMADAADVPRTPQRMHSDASEVSMVPSVDNGPSPLIENPWTGSDGGQTLGATTSASASEPILPQAAQLAAPATPAVRRSGAATPTTATPTAGGSANTSRHSITRLLPGPISSPLSSSLSAIVADQLRRGVAKPTSTSRGPRRETLRRMHSNILDAEDSGLGVDGQTAPLAAADLRPSSPLQDRKSRTRSLSASLGDLFKKGNKSSSAGKNRENGPDVDED